MGSVHDVVGIGIMPDTPTISGHGFVLQLLLQIQAFKKGGGGGGGGAVRHNFLQKRGSPTTYSRAICIANKQNLFQKEGVVYGWTYHYITSCFVLCCHFPFPPL